MCAYSSQVDATAIAKKMKAQKPFIIYNYLNPREPACLERTMDVGIKRRPTALKPLRVHVCRAPHEDLPRPAVP